MHNMAVGLWIAGKPKLAYSTLGKICAADATNIDNLSNYASCFPCSVHSNLPFLFLIA